MTGGQPGGGSAAARGDRDSARGGFTLQVRGALAHLHDPAYLETHPLTRYLPRDPSPRKALPGRALRQALLDTLESLHPGRGSGELARLSQLLQLRYVEALDVREVYDRLAISRTEFYREQQQAVEAVASILWSRWGVGEAPDADGAEEASRPTVTAPRPPNNLPIQLTSFVGREREMAEVRRLLGTTRLLTLTGTGGCGKTRLAYQVAVDLDDSPDGYRDGVWVVELAALSDPSLVPQTTASALGLREEAGRPILDTLLDHLRSKRLLVVLDNCEHLLDPSARLADHLLHACPGLRILATSRESLGIAGETSYRVPSLSMPDLQALPPLSDLVAYESVRLFVERAKAVQPSFELTDEIAPAVAQVCWRLDGMPLAIELAAARVRGLSVEGIARRLDDRFRLLTGGSRTALRRQQTLRATIDWSHHLLSDPERLLFRRLAVFAGGWSLDAAEEVCSDEDEVADGETRIEQPDVLDLLLRLVDRSLVVADAVTGEDRYRFPETIRQYAMEKLLDSGETVTLRDRHRDWCLDLAERVEPQLVGPNSLAWLGRLEREHDNLRAALAWCLEHDVEAGRELVGCLLWFWDYHCHFREGYRWSADLLATDPEQTPSRARALLTAGMMGRVYGHYEIGVQHLRECLDISRRASNRKQIGLCAWALGSMMTLDRSSEKRSLLEEALAAARDAGDRSTMALILSDLGSWATRGDGDEARRLLEESLALAREIGNRHSEALTLYRLGELALRSADLKRARLLMGMSLHILRAVGHGWLVSRILSVFGYVALNQGDQAEGRRCLAEALALARRMRDGEATVLGLWLAGQLAANAQRARRGVRLFSAADAECERSRKPMLDWARNAQETCLATTRAALGEEAFARAWAEGQAMTLEEAVEYALSEGAIS